MNISWKFILRFHPRRFRWWRYVTFMNMPSMYSEGNLNSMGDESQVRWCHLRCKRCNAIFTITILKDDIPVSTKCMCCNSLYIYTETNLIDMNII